MSTGISSKLPHPLLPFSLCLRVSLTCRQKHTHTPPSLTLLKSVIEWFRWANVCSASRICCRCCCYKFDVFLCPLSLASVGCHCACRTPEETTGIVNEEGSGARLHAPVPARLKEMTGRGKGVGWQAKTAFAFTQPYEHIFTNTFARWGFGHTNRDWTF